MSVVNGDAPVCASVAWPEERVLEVLKSNQTYQMMFVYYRVNIGLSESLQALAGRISCLFAGFGFPLSNRMIMAQLRSDAERIYCNCTPLFLPNAVRGAHVLHSCPTAVDPTHVAAILEQLQRDEMVVA